MSAGVRVQSRAYIKVGCGPKGENLSRHDKQLNGCMKEESRNCST